LLKSDQVKFDIDKVFLHVNSTDLVMGLYISRLLG